MKHFKSERLKKLEVELNDLEQWLKLGLVPKREIEKHKEEIQAITTKIAEEKERLQFLKESGDQEGFVIPKRGQTRTGYTEMPTIPDVDIAETQVGGYGGETNYGSNTEHGEGETSLGEGREEGEEDNSYLEEEDESYFSDKNRWKRGKNIVDPDANEW